MVQHAFIDSFNVGLDNLTRLHHSIRIGLKNIFDGCFFKKELKYDINLKLRKA